MESTLIHMDVWRQISFANRSNTMKQMKKLSALAAGSMTIALLLGTSLVQAEATVCLEDNTATEIKDLLVIYDNNTGSDTFDVTFRYETGFSVYGQNLDDFPFELTDGRKEEKAGATMIAINEALDPTSASSAGVSSQDSYYIGIEEEQEGDAGLIAYIGGEYIASIWEPCKTDCLLSAGIVGADVLRTWVELSTPDGAACDDGPPPGPSFSIIPAITASWKDIDRDGEGYNIEIIGTPGNYTLLVYFFTYDAAGKQMWLVGTGPVVGDTAVVPVQVTSGPVFGDLYDPTDVLRKDWGTLTFIFTSCNLGTMTYNSTMGFGMGTANISRLTSVAGLSCP
jgi:hypothetical protein